MPPRTPPTHPAALAVLSQDRRPDFLSSLALTMEPTRKAIGELPLA
jgi:hypothetical protein